MRNELLKHVEGKRKETRCRPLECAHELAIKGTNSFAPKALSIPPPLVVPLKATKKSDYCLCIYICTYISNRPMKATGKKFTLFFATEASVFFFFTSFFAAEGGAFFFFFFLSLIAAEGGEKNFEPPFLQ